VPNWQPGKHHFFLAVEYLEQGLRHLGGQAWQDHYTLTLKLSIALTRILFSGGRFRDSMSAADDILMHGKVFKHRRIVYHTKCLCLLQQGNVHEANDLILGVLKELGLSIPRRFLRFHVVTGVCRVSHQLNAMSDEEILNLPAAEENPAAEEFLIRLVELAFKGGEPLYVPIGCIKCVELLLEHGHCSVSALTLMGWEIIKEHLGDFNSFSRFQRLVLQLELLEASPRMIRAQE
jgi:predicted ATPase